MKQITTTLFLLVCSFYVNLLMATPVEPVRTMNIPFAPSPPALDGVAEDVYGEIQSTTIFNNYGYDGDADFSAWFKVCWDSEYLFVYAEVTDDIAHQYEWGVGNPWEFDQAHIFLQLDTNTVTTSYNETTIQLRVCRGLDSVESPGRASRKDYLYYMEPDAAEGWIFEVGIPWSCVLEEGSDPEDILDYQYSSIGFDASFSDSDNSDGDASVGNRDIQAAWDSDDPPDEDDRTEDLAWNNTSVFGYVSLMEGVTNPSPVADAGPDQTIMENEVGSLDGTGSYDPEDESITYKWTTSSAIVLSDRYSATPSFTAPEVSQNTTYVASLIVNDGTSNSAPDAAYIYVVHENVAPEANAGPDQTVNERELVMLDGTQSSDIDHDNLSYTWSSDQEIRMVQKTTESPLLVAPDVYEDEQIEIYLTVHDGLVASEADTMNLFITSLGDEYDTLVVYDTAYVVDVVTNTIIISVVDDEGDLIARELEGVLYIELYPNPADQFIRVRSDEMILEIEIYDMLGSLLTEEVINDVEAELNLGDFTAGNYILKMITDTGEVSKQFVLE